MIFSIAVHGHPASSPSARSALEFARAVIARCHELHRVFFYHDAVHLADSNAVSDDNAALLRDWQDIRTTSGVELALCITAGLRRGLLTEEECVRHQRPAANVDPLFEVVGLGQLAEAVIVSDRLVTFAG